MGMFDYFKCEMPLPDGTPALDWQTKSLECGMNWYAIRENGQLVDRRIRRDLKPDAPEQPEVTRFEDIIRGPYAEWSRDWWEPKEGPDEPVNYTGEIKFYSMEDATQQWWEFCAFVESGRCFKIVQIEP
jgi:hypothetical protein